MLFFSVTLRWIRSQKLSTSRAGPSVGDQATDEKVYVCPAAASGCVGTTIKTFRGHDQVSMGFESMG